MGCFFGCFRVKDRDRRHAHLISDAVSSRNRNKLAELLYGTAEHSSGSSLLNNDNARDSDLKGKSSPCMDAASPSLQFTSDKFDGDSDNRELKKETLMKARLVSIHLLGSRETEVPDAVMDIQQVKFLKSCGTILETPAEIRKTSENVEVSPNDADAVPSNFHSWLPATSCRKLLLQEQAVEVPTSPSNLFKEFRKMPLLENSGSPKHDSHRSEKLKQTERNLNLSIEISAPNNTENILPDACGNQIGTTQYQNKYVRFECTEHYPSEIDCQSCNPCDSLELKVSQTQILRPSYSPYPTPLKLTDQMQTPGTVYPTNLDNLAISKNARIRSQYVFPVLNTVENLAQWKALKGDSNAHELVDPGEFLEQSDHASPDRPEPGKTWDAIGDSMKHNKREIPVSVDSSLSHWLKPVLPNHAGNRSAWTASNARSHSGRSSDDDRPIIGTVAAHWNDEQSQISHRWWDGTGIPNSKSRYREVNLVLPKSHSGQHSDSDRPIVGTVAAHWNEEQSQISPKWWDGNGIPNSTNKYKEDQKVSWHATPFEERLEKALSDERLLPQRKLVDLEESEESDTAASRLSASDHGHSILVSHV